MRNQKGITLIALVITIIVLLILAGVSIAMLTGENGILTRAGDAKQAQIEGEVQERINLAIQATKMYAEQKAVETSSGWLASSKIGANTDAANADTVIGQLKNDLDSNYSYSVSGTTLTITYESSDYDAATNYSSASIVATVSITGNTFDITSLKATRAADEVITIVGTN